MAQRRKEYFAFAENPDKTLAGPIITNQPGRASGAGMNVQSLEGREALANASGSALGKQILMSDTPMRLGAMSPQALRSGLGVRAGTDLPVPGVRFSASAPGANRGTVNFDLRRNMLEKNPGVGTSDERLALGLPAKHRTASPGRGAKEHARALELADAERGTPARIRADAERDVQAMRGAESQADREARAAQQQADIEARRNEITQRAQADLAELQAKGELVGSPEFGQRSAAEQGDALALQADKYRLESDNAKTEDERRHANAMEIESLRMANEAYKTERKTVTGLRENEAGEAVPFTETTVTETAKGPQGPPAPAGAPAGESTGSPGDTDNNGVPDADKVANSRVNFIRMYERQLKADPEGAFVKDNAANYELAKRKHTEWLTKRTSPQGGSQTTSP